MKTTTFILAFGSVLALGACNRPAPTSATVPPPPLQPAASPGVTTAPPLQPVNGAASATPAPAANIASGYSCSFPGPGRQVILARFTLSGGAAHDDQGTPFQVITDSPTALVLASTRDAAAGAAGGDLVVYTVAIDRRDLSMVQSTVSVRGAGATRRGHCIAG